MINMDNKIILNNTEAILQLTANRIQTRLNQDNKAKINKSEGIKEIILKLEDLKVNSQDNKIWIYKASMNQSNLANN